MLTRCRGVVALWQGSPPAPQKLFLRHQLMVMPVQKGLSAELGMQAGGTHGVELAVDECFDILCCDPFSGAHP